MAVVHKWQLFKGKLCCKFTGWGPYKWTSGRYIQEAVIRRWPLHTGGRYSEVAVITGLTVFFFPVSEFFCTSKRDLDVFEESCNSNLKNILKISTDYEASFLSKLIIFKTL